MISDEEAAAPQRFARMSRRWNVQVGRVVETPSSIIAVGVREGAHVVLKVAKSPHDEWNAGRVISRFSGSGMVRALQHVPGAVLLEEIRPATPLVDLVRAGRDNEATDVIVSVIQAMGTAAADMRDIPRAADWGESFDRYISRGGDLLPAALVRSGRDVYRELCSTQRHERLLHGDLHHYNVVRDDERGWLALDPKGVVAECEFELGAALRNPHGMPELYTTAAIERRASQLASKLTLDLSRVVKWTFAQAVLSAIWSIEDDEWRQDSPMLDLARAAEALLA